MAWTDERLQERFDSIDRRFDEVDRRFDRVDGELLELRREMQAGFSELRMTMIRFGGGLLIAQFGMIAALVARG